MIATWNLQLLPEINELKNVCFSLTCLFYLLECGDYYLNNNTFIYLNSNAIFFIVYFNKYGTFIYGYDRDSIISPNNQSEFYFAKPWIGLFNNLPIEFHNDIKKILVETLLSNNPKYDMDVDKINFDDLKNKLGKNFDENKPLLEFIDEIWEIIDNQENLHHFYPTLTYLIWKTNEDKEWKTNLYNFDKNDDFKDGSKKLSILENNIFNVYDIIEDYGVSHEKYDTNNDYRYVNLKILEHIYSHKPIGNRIIKKVRPNIKKEDIQRLKENLKSIGYPIV